MDSMNSIQSLSPAKDTASIAGRVIASFGSEIDQLLAMTVEASVTASPSYLGANVDVRA